MGAKVSHFGRRIFFEGSIAIQLCITRNAFVLIRICIRFHFFRIKFYACLCNKNSVISLYLVPLVNIRFNVLSEFSVESYHTDVTVLQNQKVPTVSKAKYRG